MAVFVLDRYCSAQVTETGLREKFAASESEPMLAWAPGMNAWRPIAEVAATFPEPATGGDMPNQKSFQFWPAAILTAMILWAAAITSGNFILWNYLPDSVSSSTAFVLHVGVVGLGMLFTFFGMIYFWRRPGRQAGMPMAGAVFLFALITTLLDFGNFIGTTISAKDWYRALAAQDEFENATVFRGSDGTVYIMGSIGPSLVQDFHKAEEEGPVSKVEITSSGGLVNSALTLAAYIEAQKLPVIVRGYCYSACVHIAVASPESYADQGAIFGFHRTTPIIALDTESLTDADAQSSEEAANFLRAHGVPETVLAIAHKHAGESIYEVTADEMVNYGAIKGTVSGTKVIRTGSKQ